MSDLSERVFGNQLILSKILSFLTLKQLTKDCISVNQMWNRETQNVIRSRTEVQHYFELYRFTRIRRVPNYFNNRERESQLADKKLSFISDCFEQIETKLTDKLRNDLYVWPHLVITFFGNFCPHSKSIKSLMEYNSFRQHLPPDSQLLNIVSSYGVIGSVIRSANQTQNLLLSTSSGDINESFPPNESAIEPIQAHAHVSDCAGISLIIFPKYPNVEIDVIDDQNLDILEKLKSRSDLKCLLVFSTSCAGDTHDFREFQSINELRDKYNNKIAMGGILLDEIIHLSTNLISSPQKSHSFYGIAFSGTNVRACSLHINTVTPEDTERKFQQFKQNLDFDVNEKTYETMAFMFICTGRGAYAKGHHISNTTLEATIFSHVFPNVKVVGIFGNGEFGHNYWPSITRQNQLKLSEELQEASSNAHELWHFYTSVVVLVHLPKK